MNITQRPVAQKPAKAIRDQAYLRKVRQLPCVIGFHFGEPCNGPVAAHHVFHDRYSFGKVGDDMTIPLCHFHHQGAGGIHTDKSDWRQRFGADHEYIAWTRDMIGQSHG